LTGSSIPPLPYAASFPERISGDYVFPGHVNQGAWSRDFDDETGRNVVNPASPSSKSRGFNQRFFLVKGGQAIRTSLWIVWPILQWTLNECSWGPPIPTFVEPNHRVGAAEQPRDINILLGAIAHEISRLIFSGSSVFITQVTSS